MGYNYGMTERTDAIVLSNGTLKDPVTGYFMTQPDPEHRPIKNSQDATDMINHRWELWREAELTARRGMQNVADDSRWQTTWARIAQEQSKLATDIKAGRSSTEAARFIRDAAGLAPARGETDTPAGGATITLSADAMQLIAELAAQMLASRGE